MSDPYLVAFYVFPFLFFSGYLPIKRYERPISYAIIICFVGDLPQKKGVRATRILIASFKSNEGPPRKHQRSGVDIALLFLTDRTLHMRGSIFMLLHRLLRIAHIVTYDLSIVHCDNLMFHSYNITYAWFHSSCY